MSTENNEDIFLMSQAELVDYFAKAEKAKLQLEIERMRLSNGELLNTASRRRDENIKLRAELADVQAALLQKDEALAQAHHFFKECANCKNGVVDENTGQDEGEVYADRMLGEMHAALALTPASLAANPAGASGELAQLKEDKEALDWLDKNLLSLYDAGGAWCIEWGPLSDKKILGDGNDIWSPREAIRAARQNEKGAK